MSKDSGSRGCIIYLKVNSREIARASAERDKAIAALQLGAKVERPWLALPAPNGNGEEAQ